MENKTNAELDDFVHLSFFVEIGKAIASARTLHEILSRVMEQIGAIFAPLNWSLLIYDKAKSELVFKIVVGEAADKLVGHRIDADEGISGWIFRKGQAVIIEDVRKDSRFNPSIDEMTGFRTSSIIGVPLKTEKEVLGVIELVNKLDGSNFTPLELKTLSTIADFAAIALEKAFYIRAIRKMSRHDYLTGLLNRRSLDSILSREKERCKRYGQPLSVLLIDVDNFKQINDTHGHAVGDDVLRNCSDIVRASVRQIDYCARYGGDEFAVIMPSTAEDEAEGVRRRILAGIAAAAGPTAYTVSIGVHSAGPDDVEGILEKTDESLYRYKDLRPPLRMDEHLLDFYDDEENDGE